MSPPIPEIYTNRTRIRVCGLCWRGDSLLMVNHAGLTSGSFWAPPGGGVEFGEAAHETLTREFREEAMLVVQPGNLQFVCEYIQPPLHAVELFFGVVYPGDDPRKGFDPETSADSQIITEVRFMHMEEILALPEPERHGIFRKVQSIADLKNLSGFHRI